MSLWIQNYAYAFLRSSQLAALSDSADSLCTRVGALQSCSRQAEYAVEQQRGASELQAAHAESSRLADALAQAECAKQALDAQLNDVHSHHRKVCLQLCAPAHNAFFLPESKSRVCA